MANCKRCWVPITSTAVVASTTEITITIPATTLVAGNTTGYRLYVPQNIPQAARGLPVIVDNGGTAIPVWGCGEAEAVLGFQLAPFRMRQCCNTQHCIPMIFVSTGITTNPDHFTVPYRLPCDNV